MILRGLVGILRYLASWHLPRKLRRSEVRSILVVELTRLGDVVVILPLLKALKSHFANAEVYLLIDERYVTLVRALELDVVPLGIRSPISAGGMLSACLAARKCRPDLACSMSPPKRNAAVALASGARFKVGYLTHVDSLAPYLLTTPVEAFGFRESAHLSYGMENIGERGRRVIEAMGINPVEYSNEVVFREGIEERTKEMLQAHGVLPERKYVVMHPFSGWRYRNWDLERFNTLAGRIVATLPFDVVFVCDPREVKDLEPSLRQFEGEGAVHFYSSNDLLHTAVILKNATLFVGNDSGPLHLATALGTSVVGLFGPASPLLTAPHAEHGTFLYRKVDCSPCDQRKCIRPNDHCMSLITVEDVFTEIVAHVMPARMANA